MTSKKRWKLHQNRPINRDTILAQTTSASHEECSGLGAWQTKNKHEKLKASTQRQCNSTEICCHNASLITRDRRTTVICQNWHAAPLSIITKAPFVLLYEKRSLKIKIINQLVKYVTYSIPLTVSVKNKGNDDYSVNDKSAQRDANTARWL